MILQTQYKLHKWLLNLIILAIMGLLSIGVVYYYKGKLYENDINKKVLKINKLQEKIISEKNNNIYKTYQMGKVIYKQGNNINYFGLYRYLNFVKNSILSDFKDYKILRFILSMQPNKIIINTTLPSYNVIYTSGGLIDLLNSNTVVKNLNINNFKKLDNGVNVDIQIDTK